MSALRLRSIPLALGTLALLAAAPACGEADTPGEGVGDAGGDTGTDEWWAVEDEGATASQGTTLEAGTTSDEGLEEGEEEFEEEEEEEEGEEDFIGWYVWGTVTPGVSLEGAVEYIRVTMGEEQCFIEGSIAMATPLDDCEACEWAFELTLGAGEGEACPEAMLDPAGLAGMSFAVGYAGEESYQRVDGAWIVVGEGFTEGSEFELSLVGG